MSSCSQQQHQLDRHEQMMIFRQEDPDGDRDSTRRESGIDSESKQRPVFTVSRSFPTHRDQPHPVGRLTAACLPVWYRVLRFFSR